MKKILMITAVLLLFAINVYAEFDVNEITSQQLEKAGGKELSQAAGEANEFSHNFDYMDTANNLMQGKSDEPKGILKNFLNLLFKEVKDSISICLKIILVALCLSMVSNFLSEKEKIMDVAFYVCYMVIFIMCMNSFKDAVKIGKEAIESMDFFMKAAVPVFGGLMVASGGFAKAGIVSLSILGISAAIGVISGLIFPLSMSAAVLSGVNNLSKDFNLKGLSSMLKKTSIWCLGIIMTVFTAIVTTRSLAASGLDNVTSKTIKYAAGNFIPIVGGVISDTLESVVACGKLVKGAAGGAGIIAVLYICLSPVIKLLAIIVTYKLAAVVISPITDIRISEAVLEFSSSLTMILALVISVGIMFMICAGIIAAI